MTLIGTHEYHEAHLSEDEMELTSDTSYTIYCWKAEGYWVAEFCPACDCEPGQYVCETGAHYLDAARRLMEAHG